MMKKLIIASAVCTVFATSMAYAQQDSQRTSAQNNTGNQAYGQSSGATSRNQDAPSGGVGQVFPNDQAQSGSSAGASGTSGAAASGNTMNRNQDAPSGGVGQVFPNDRTQSSGSSGNQSGSAGSSSGQRQGNAQGGKRQGSANAPVYLLVPVETAANDTAMRNGCWARVYSRENFSGDALTLVGPTSLPDMDQAGLFGLNWDDRVSSIELGPKATMTVYDNENFRDIVGQFKPGQRVPDIDTRTGFFDEFSSVKVDCQKA